MTTSILVVDDSPVERLLVESMLARNPDYRVDLAEDGKQALAKIGGHPPDLVIADLIMPHLGGLELIRRLRQRHPRLPVILLTACGNETVALEALEAGAASYVPKARQAERLPGAVQRVLEHAAADRYRAQLQHSVLEYHCRFALENDLQLLRTLVDHTQQVLAGLGFGDAVERIRTGEALEQALLNALYHGNLEVNERELAAVRSELDDQLLADLVEQKCCDPEIKDRRIVVVVHVTPSEARFVVRDQGRGFSRAGSPSATERFEGGLHRGTTLMQCMMDEVSYNDAGNELTLRKRWPGRSTSSASPHRSSSC